MPSEDSEISDVSKRTLNDWQQSAVRHFTSLSNSKKDKKLPIFILEHNFIPSELQLLTSLLLKDYAQHGINRSYWLLWTIYATEIGYEYTGEEYWQSFEEKIKKWDFQQREEIRWAFKEFQKKYTAIVPTGSWANHFSIISLPITHAILPKDLQFHFAKLLFFTRYKLKTVSLQNPSSIGKVLSANSYTINSTRFQNFLQQEELVGRIALALLNNNSDKTAFEFLYQPTLRRIVSDLEQKRNAREWVHETRRELKPKIIGTGSTSIINQALTTPKESIQRQLLLKPSLKLFQGDKNSWSVIVEIPKFQELLDVAELATYLKSTRVQIPCSKGNWLPSEILVHSPLKKRLVIWPDNNPLIKFETPHPILNNIVNLDFRISKGPWLFDAGATGTASEIEGKILRPGKKYIALFSNKEPIPSEISNDITIDCENVTGKELLIPNIVSYEEELKYKKWGFNIFKSVTIWPAGLSARTWDGEGNSEWLTTESPMFGIVHDYELNDVVVKIGTESMILANKTGEVSFVKIGHLPVGKHILSVKSNSKSLPSSEGVVVLNIREPVSWTPGLTLHNGLTIFLDPNDEDLDSFLRGKTELTIYGPQNRAVIIQIDLFLGDRLLDTFKSQLISFPFTIDKLKSIRSQVGKLESVDIADKAKLLIICDDIGNKEFILTRNVKPFRWTHKIENGKSFIRLIDEIDNNENAKLSFFDVLKPDQEINLSSPAFIQKKEIDLNGLFWAKKINYEHAIIISTIKKSTKFFEGLSIDPILKTDQPFSLLEHLNLIRMWYTAQCVTPTARLHLEKIVEILTEKLYSNLCGPNWAKEEMNFITNLNYHLALDGLAELIENRSIANITRHRLSSKNADEIIFTDELKWFIGASYRCDLCKNESLVRSSIQFASNPLSVIPDLLNGQNVLINKIRANADLLRASRLLILGLSRLVDPYRNYSLLMSANFK